jgi:hypothetical protein
MPLVERAFTDAAEMAEFINGRYNIVGINQGLKLVTVAGHRTALLAPTDTFNIVGSTGNNGLYTVNTITVNDEGNTEIVTVEALPSAVADGQIQVDQVAQADIQGIEGRDSIFVLFYWVP